MTAIATSCIEIEIAIAQFKANSQRHVVTLRVGICKDYFAATPSVNAERERSGLARARSAQTQPAVLDGLGEVSLGDR